MADPQIKERAVEGRIAQAPGLGLQELRQVPDLPGRRRPRGTRRIESLDIASLTMYDSR